jgi:aryl-alcohol dehydrogenase-like predicted oxidoreductase
LNPPILPTLRELGVGVTAYGVLSRGLLAERPAGGGGAASDYRAHLPRFTGENRERNLRLVEAVGALAREKGVSVAQLAIVWALARGDDIVPLVGARRRASLAEALGALEVRLSPEELARIEAAVPPGATAGDRYPPEQMAMLDSERRAG